MPDEVEIKENKNDVHMVIVKIIQPAYVKYVKRL